MTYECKVKCERDKRHDCRFSSQDYIRLCGQLWHAAGFLRKNIIHVVTVSACALLGNGFTMLVKGAIYDSTAETRSERNKGAKKVVEIVE